MKTIEKYLQSDDLRYFPKLLGEKVRYIYSNSLHVDLNQHIYESNSFSLYSKKCFLNFQTFWLDFDDYEYYKLNITQSATPKGISRDNMGALMNPSKIIIAPETNIVKIELFEDKDEEEWNSRGRELITVKYDSALLFSQSDGNKFLIGVSETIADLTQFIRHEQATNARLEGLSKRLEWK